MSEFKKLFRAKRILAMLLVVAMAVTSIPVTANAAPLEPQAEAGQPDDEPDNVQLDEAPTTDAQDEDSEDSSDTQEPEEDIPTADADDEEGTNPDTSEDEMNAKGDETENETETPAAQAETVEYSFGVDDTIDTTAEYNADETRFSDEIEASEGVPASMQVKYDILSKIYLQGKDNSRIYLSNTYNELVQTVTYAWQQDGKALGEGKAPKDVGKYQLVIKLPAKADEYTEAVTTVDFEITKAKVTVDFFVPMAAPGTAAKDVTIEDVYIEATDGTYFNYGLEDDKATTDIDESTLNEVDIELTVKDAIADESLTSTDKLVKGKDYVVALAPKFIGKNAEAYAKNYEFEKISDTKVEVDDLKLTNVIITLDGKYDAVEGTEKNVASTKSGQIVNKIAVSYDGSEVTKPVYTAKVVDPAGGVDKDGKPISVDIADAKVSDGEWHTATYESWEETVTDEKGISAPKQFCSLTVGGKLDSAPVDAGTYVYRVGYEGDQKEYAPSYADIVVVVEQVELIIRPVLSVASFNEGQTAADVLAKVTPKVVKADGSEFVIPKEDKDSFWGTSYSSSTRTQPYEPVFEVVETYTETTTNEAGVEIDKYTDSWVLDKTEALSSNTIETDEAGNTITRTYEYAVRFSGEKAVYNAAGAAVDSKDINATNVNSANNNYVVKADGDTRNNDDNIAKFSVNKSKLAVINTEEITKALLGRAGVTVDTDFHDALTKVYDGNALYTNRADYKKAKVEFDGKDIGVKSTDLVYQWYRNYRYDNAVDAKNDKDENGNYIESDDFAYSFDEIYNISPVNAGIYKLEITYEDKTGEYSVEPASVYFVIEKQKVYVELDTEINYEEFSGVSADDFLTYHRNEIEYSIKTELPSPGLADCYVDVDFLVEEKQKNEDGSDLTDENGNTVYEPLAYYETFQIDPSLEKDNGDNYRLAVGSLAIWDDYDDYYAMNYTAEETTIEKKTVQTTDPETGEAVERTTEEKKTVNLSYTAENTAKITVKRMGDTAIEIDTGSEQQFREERVYDGESVYKDFQKVLDKIKVVKAVANEDGTKDTVTDAPLTYNLIYDYERFLTPEELDDDPWYGEYYSGDILEEDLPEVLSSLVNGGTYRLSVGFRGDEKYQPIPATTIATLEVTQREITITPPTLEDDYAAGDRADKVTAAARKAFEAGNATIDGYVDKDKDFFASSSFYPYTYPAWTEWHVYNEYYKDYEVSYPTFSVYDKVEKRKLENWEVLKGEGSDRYTLQLNGVGRLYGICNANYKVTAGGEAPLTIVKGNATVLGTSVSGVAKAETSDNIEGMKHRITVMNGINFTTYGGNEGNFVAVQIMAPAEYEDDSDIWNRAVFEASIQEAGGAIVGYPDDYANYTTDTQGRDRTYITVVFDAQNKEDVTFGIHWDNDYIETFTMAFSEAICLGNLKDAVAPKSLAFNTPNKKMVVGAIQDLDVKMTKVQKDDVILLGYEVTGTPGILSVSEYGRVTALAKGSATVTVYPMHLVNGVKEPIKDAKGKYVKSASVKITVTDVAAPKISKATPLDNKVTVQYSLVDNGYRREIYVLEGKNLKEKDFTDKIDAMTNEQWEGIFDVAPRFVTGSNETSTNLTAATHRVYDSKKHVWTNATQTTIAGLKANTTYTVYVRNVSAVRTLSDGSQVVLSTAGSVKSFTTTKAQVKFLQSLLDGKEMEYEERDESGFYTYSYYEVKLSEGKVKLDTYGIFEDPSEAANHEEQYEWYDVLGIKLPLSGEDKKTYVDPKLAYYVWAYADENGCYDAYTGEKVSEDWYRSTSNACVSIDKKGNITLKQPGYVQIVVVDTTTGQSSNQIDLRIGAVADSIKAKATTLQVGQSIRLENLVDYMEGKIVLNQRNNDHNHDPHDDAYDDEHDGANGYDTYNRIDRTGLKEKIEAGGYFELSDNGYVTAVKKGGNLKLTLVDRELEAPKNSAAITLKSIDLAAVKNLKLVDVIDNKLTVQFEESPYADAYRIEVRDSRNSLRRSVYLRTNACSYVKNPKTGKYDIVSYSIGSLTQQSKYTVSVTALYRQTLSKTVTKSVTTTKMPAYDYGLNKGDYGAYDEYYGIPVKVWDKGRDTDINEKTFVSGNTYTITAKPVNTAAQYAITDTLTWTSTNTKAATVKANAGTYSATLKAVKTGDTYIEVWSKITKKLIARYMIHVVSVGDAYNNQYFYDDNEDLRGNGSTPDTAYTELTLGVPVAVELVSGQTQSFRFTAPEDGRYGLYRVTTNGSKSVVATWVLGEKESGTYTANGSGSYSLVVEKLKGTDPAERTPLKIGENKIQSVVSGQYFVFTAESEGIYQFNGLSFTVTDTEGNQKTSGYSPQCWLENGETIYLRADSSRNYETIINVEKVPVQSLTADGDAISISDTNGWFSFTAPKAAEYEFVLSGTSGSYKYINLYNRSNLSSSITGMSDSDEEITCSYMLGSGATVLIKASPVGSMLAVKTKGVMETITTGGDEDITLYPDRNSYFEFAAPEDGFYQFTLSGVSGAQVNLYKDLTGEPVDSYNGYDDVLTVSCYLKKGQQGYLTAQSINGDEQEGVKVKVESITPVEIKAEEDTREINADQWYSFTAAETEKYTFTFTSDASCSAFLYTLGALGTEQPNPTAKLDLGYAKKHYDYDMTKGQTVYWKVRSYGSANVTVKAEKYKLPSLDEGNNIYDIEVNTSQIVTFTAPEDGLYTFKFSSDNGYGMNAYLYQNAALTNMIDSVYFYNNYQSPDPYMYTAKEGETVYWKLENRFADVTVTVNVEKFVINPLAEGDNTYTVNAGSSKYFSFTAPENNKYIFRFSSNSNNYTYARLYQDQTFSSQIGYIYFNNGIPKTHELDAKEGDTVYWKLDNENNNENAIVTVRVEKLTIDSLSDGENLNTVDAGSSKYFSYTAPKDGEYLFAFKNDTGYTSHAYKYPDKDFDSSNDYIYFSRSYKFSDKYTLSEGETVYWKIENTSGSDMEVSIYVKEDVLVEVTAGGASADVFNGLDQWFSFTADEDTIYSFTVTSDNAVYSVYFYRDMDGSSESSKTYMSASQTYTDEKYIEKGETVYWKVNCPYSGNITKATVNVQKESVTTVTAEETEPSSAAIPSKQTRWFSISLPDSDAEYVITAMSTDATCNVYLYADLPTLGSSLFPYDYNVSSGDWNSKNWKVSGSVGNKVYLKATNNSSANDTRFKVAVKKYTEVDITEDGSAVTIAPGAEQWFIFTSTKDTRYSFTLISDAEQCTWYRYEDDDTTSYEEYYTAKTEQISKEIHIPVGTTERWMVKNQSISNSISVTVTVNAIDIQEINSTQEGPITVEADSSRWLSYPVDAEGRYEFTFTNTNTDNTSCSVYLYKDLDALQLDYFTVSANKSANKDYYVSETIYIKLVNNGTAEVEFTVDADRVAPEDVDAENGFEFNTKAQWFKFTAEEDGLYRFGIEADDTNFNRYLYLYKELSDSSFSKSFYNTGSIDYAMSAEETVYLKVYSSNDNNVTGTLTVEPVPVEILSKDSNVKISLDNRIGYAKFVANETGIYSFKPVENTSDYGYLYLYLDLNDNSYTQQLYYSSASTDSLVYPLMAGDAIYVKVQASNASASALTVNVTEESMEEITVDDQPISLSLKESEEKWICFQTSAEFYYYYMNASWDSEAELTIKHPNSTYYDTLYKYSTWKTSASYMTSITKMVTFTNQTLNTKNRENLYCICIIPDQDVDITFSITSDKQN